LRVPNPAPRPPRPTLLPRFGDRRTLRIGLLGGSFNPAHDGHLHIARTALKRLRLDQVWLLVSPGNPLKPAAGMAPLPERLASARRIADGRRIVATDIERHLGTRYTADTLAALRRRFPRVRFVWLMGADNLVQLPRWRRWLRIVAAAPFAVMPRPTYNHAALAALAARRLRRRRIAPQRAAALAALPAPAWIFLPMRQNASSATRLRQLMKDAGNASPPHDPRGENR
jgi:nicotinate-nucleotide adenylyltransferase